MRTEAVDRGVLVGQVSVSLVVSVDVPIWMQQCESPPPCCGQEDIFFPVTYTKVCHDQIAQAKDICRACPLIEACQSWAVERPSLDGVWGATTPLDRRRIRMGRMEAAS